MKALYLFGLTLLISCGQKTQDTIEIKTPATVMKERLQKVVADNKYIFGHADDTAYGHSWAYEPGRSDVNEVAGDYPGLINWDLGKLELDSLKNLDGVPFDYMVAEIRNQHARGGINSISWHLRNPVTGGDSWDVSNPLSVKEIVVEGTDANKVMKEWITKTADFIGNLKDENGEGIPVLYRPWHEHTGSWFWWGAKGSTPTEYKSLWKMTREIFDEKGVDNVVWVYSPDRVPDLSKYMERYPGDDYVDVMGIDIYQFGAEEGIEKFKEDVRGGLEIAAKAAQEHGKLLAFTETGLESIPVYEWYSDILYPAIESFPIAYVCVWRNAQEATKPDHFYAPYPGHPSAESFIEFYNKPKTLFARDLKTYN